MRRIRSTYRESRPSASPAEAVRNAGRINEKGCRLAQQPLPVQVLCASGYFRVSPLIDFCSPDIRPTIRLARGLRARCHKPSIDFAKGQCYFSVEVAPSGDGVRVTTLGPASPDDRKYRGCRFPENRHKSTACAVGPPRLLSRPR